MFLSITRKHKDTKFHSDKNAVGGFSTFMHRLIEKRKVFLIQSSGWCPLTTSIKVEAETTILFLSYMPHGGDTHITVAAVGLLVKLPGLRSLKRGATELLQA